MKATVIFGFITIGVLLLASSAFAEDEEYDITGQWYVTGVKGSKVPMQYRCWSIIITSPDPTRFAVKSSFQNAETGEWYGVRLLLNRDKKNIQTRDQFHDFSGTGKTYEHDQIVLNGAQLWVDKQDEVAAIRYISINGTQSQYVEELYLHRTRFVTAEDAPNANQMVDNLYC